MARSAVWNGRILLALHERRETRDVLVLGRQATRKVPSVPADIVRRHLDPALADGRGPQEIDGQPREMRQSVFGGGVFDRATDQRRRRPGVLMVGMPRAAGQMSWRETCRHRLRYRLRPMRALRRCAALAPVGAVSFCAMLRLGARWFVYKPTGLTCG